MKGQWALGIKSLLLQQLLFFSKTESPAQHVNYNLNSAFSWRGQYKME